MDTQTDEGNQRQEEIPLTLEEQRRKAEYLKILEDAGWDGPSKFEGEP